MIWLRMMPELPTSAPEMISTSLLMTKPVIAGRDARIGIEQRDDDRHVGAADRDHQQHAEDQRQRHQSARNGTISGDFGGNLPRRQRDDHEEQQRR